MEIKITINPDSASFEDDMSGQLRELLGFCKGYLFEALRDRDERSPRIDETTLHDVNGNRCGSLRIEWSASALRAPERIETSELERSISVCEALASRGFAADGTCESCGSIIPKSDYISGSCGSCGSELTS